MKKPIYKKLNFWLILISFIIAMLVIFATPYIWDSFKDLIYRILIASFIFFGTIMGILLAIVFKKEETQEALQEKKEQLEIKRQYRAIIKEKLKDVKFKFNNAIKIIKKSSLYKYKRNAQYELPWYLVLGDKSEGKTTLLESSGLEYPLNVNYDDKDIQEERSSDKFEWYFSEKSVFIDMPSIYIEQKQNPEDPIIWKEFLKLFTKKRWRRPISGIILTVSADTLMNNNEKEIEQYAKNLRDRFDELSKAFMSSVPIYLIITKSDNIEGFNEYFASISKEEQDEILGVTFNSENKNIDNTLVKPELEKLLKRLNSSVLERMHYEWEDSNKNKIYLFCENFSSLFEQANLFIDICFSQTRYRKPLMLRGIYFTSVPNETNSSMLVDKTQLDAPRASKGLFIKKLLSDIIFPESEIIVMDENYKKKVKRNQIIAYILAIVFTVFISLYLAKDYIVHNVVLIKLGKTYNIYKEQRDDLNKNDSMEDAVFNLNNIDRLIQYHNRNLNDDLWKLLFYEVDNRNKKLDNIYLNDLNALFLPRIIKNIENKIKKDINNFNATWNNTQAYVMLENLEHRDDEFLKKYMATYWNIKYPHNIDLQNDLNYHWANFLKMGFKIDLSNSLVLRKARNRLIKEGAEVLVYNGLKKQFTNIDVKDFSFSQVLGNNLSQFEGSTYLIPGFFTKDGSKIMLKQGKELTKDVLKNNWIIGKRMDLNEAEINRYYKKILSYYFSDYKKYWTNALGKLRIRTQSSISSLNNQLSVFSSADSPILAILTALKENTQIYTEAELLQMKAKDGIGNAVVNTVVSGQVARAVTKKVRKSGVSNNRSIKNLRAYFEQYNKLLDKEFAAKEQLQNANAALNKAYQAMTAIYGAVTPKEDAFKIVSSRISGQGTGIVVPLNQLPLHIKKWYTNILTDNWRFLLMYAKSYINSVYKKEVIYFYKERLKGKYPLNKYSNSYVKLDDFSDFYRENGVLDRFYKNYILSFVKINSNNRTYSLKSIDGVRMHFDSYFMKAILRANRIRRIFFKNDGSLGLVASIKPYNLSNNLATVELFYDDEPIYYEHGPIKSRKIVWPAQTLNNVVKFNLFDLNNNLVVEKYLDNDWALFKIIDSFSSIPSSNGGVIITYKDNKYDVAFELKGNISSVFSQYNSLSSFKLKDGL